MSKNIIIDTDIGTDVDDIYALLFGLMSPELNVLGFSVVYGKQDVRAALIRRLLIYMGREDIPILGGISQPLNANLPVVWIGHEGEGLGEDEIQPIEEGKAVEFFARNAVVDGKRSTLIAIGPLTNVATAIQKYPEAMKQYDRIVMMASSFKGYGKECSVVEHNLKCDSVAAKIVYESGIKLDIIGLNCTEQTPLHKTDVEKIRDFNTSTASYLAQQTDVWYRFIDNSYTYMHDALAVMTVCNDTFAEWVSVDAEVIDEEPGRVMYQPNPDSHIRIMTTFDLDYYNTLFLRRIHAGCGV